MMEKPIHAPGCFAAASVFSHDSNICKACSAFAPCSEASVETLKRIQGLVNVEDLLKKHSVAKAKYQALGQVKFDAVPPANKFAEAAKIAIESREQPKMPVEPVERHTEKVKVMVEIDATTNDIIAKLPVKPRDLAVTLCKRGTLDTMRGDLSAGRNPFATSKPEFMRVVCDALLNGGFTKPQLKKLFMEKLKWGDGTAGSHVAIACALITAFGIVQENEGKLILAPALSV